VEVGEVAEVIVYGIGEDTVSAVCTVLNRAGIGVVEDSAEAV